MCATATTFFRVLFNIPKSFNCMENLSVVVRMLDANAMICPNPAIVQSFYCFRKGFHNFHKTMEVVKLIPETIKRLDNGWVGKDYCICI